MEIVGQFYPYLKKTIYMAIKTFLFVTLTTKVARGLIIVDRQICISCSHAAQVCIQLGLTSPGHRSEQKNDGQGLQHIIS